MAGGGYVALLRTAEKILFISPNITDLKQTAAISPLSLKFNIACFYNPADKSHLFVSSAHIAIA